MAVSSAGDAIEGGGDRVADTMEGIGDFAGKAVEAGARAISEAAAATGNPMVMDAGAIAGGIIFGLVEAARDAGCAIMNVGRDILGILCGGLRGDPGYMLVRSAGVLVHLLGLATAIVWLVIGRYFVDGIATHRKRGHRAKRAIVTQGSLIQWRRSEPVHRHQPVIRPRESDFTLL